MPLYHCTLFSVQHVMLVMIVQASTNHFTPELSLINEALVSSVHTIMINIWLLLPGLKMNFFIQEAIGS